MDAVTLAAANATTKKNYIRTIGPSNGTDDTATINALLTAARQAGGGYVRGLPGQTYLLTAPLVIGSNTTLDVIGCTVKVKTGSLVNNINNYALGQSTTVQDATMTAASAALACTTSLPFGSVTVGTPIMVWGAGPLGTPLRSTVASVTDSGHVTLADAASVAVTATPATIGARDKNITILGGNWHRSGQLDSSPAHSDCIRLRRCDRTTVNGAYFGDTGFHNVCFGDATNFSVNGVRTEETTQTDAVHLHGPLDGGVIENIQGYGASMLVSITPNDYAGSNDVYGPVTNLDINGVHASPENTGGLVAMDGGSTASGTYCRGIRVRNISGPTNGSQGLVSIIDDTASPNTVGGLITDITVENVTGRVNNANSCLVGITAGKVGNVRISGLYAENAAQTFAVGLVWASNLATIAGLQVENVVVSTLAASTAAVRVDGQVTNLIVDRVRSSNSLTYVLLAHGSAAVISRVLLSNLALTAGSPIQVDNSAATVPHITISNVQGVGGYGLGDIACTTEVHAVNVQSQPTANILNIGSASAVITLRATNCNFNGKTLQGTAGGTVRSLSLAFPLDVSSTFLAKNTSDLAYNTNGALACGVGPVGYTGTAWKNLISGATY